MRIQIIATLGALVIASPALAQQEEPAFDGPYIGASVGYGMQNNDVGEFQRFDRGLDGSFDTVTTTTGADAFSPGFCNGAARGATPGAGCRNDKDDIEYHARAGWDAQFGNVVVGIVGEFGKSKLRDSVSSFSTTPASYTMTREIDWDANLRLRAGYALGGTTLFYATGGGAYARIDNSFTTTNTVNLFQDNGTSDSWGFAAGGGVEQKLGRNLSFGLEYLYTRFNDDEYRVRALAGNAVASNPFILNGQPGTEFSRSAERFDYHAIRATLGFRF